jgi:hypothetical protein
LKNLDEWYKKCDSTKAQEVFNPKINIDPERWLNGYTRNPIPLLVIWDLGTRQPKPEGVGVAATLNSPGWQPKRFSYWLFIRDPKLNSTDIVRAKYSSTKISNWISFNTPTTYLALLLNESMLDFGKNVDVWVNGIKLPPPIKLAASKKIQDETWKARRDPRLVFSAVVYLERSGNNRVAKTADSLAAIEGRQKFISKP